MATSDQGLPAPKNDESLVNVYTEGTTDSAFNILSIDGGSPNAVIPATIIDKMEKYAYTYGLDNNYISSNDDEKLSMIYLFDMFASTSTSSVLAAMLVTPDSTGKDPAYYASDVIDWFTNIGPEIFTQQKISAGSQWGLTLICIGIGLVCGLQLGNSIFQNDQVEFTNRRLKAYIRELKKKQKKKIHHATVDLNNEQMSSINAEPAPSHSALAEAVGRALLAKYNFSDISDGKKIQSLL